MHDGVPAVGTVTCMRAAARRRTATPRLRLFQVLAKHSGDAILQQDCCWVWCLFLQICGRFVPLHVTPLAGARKSIL